MNNSSMNLKIVPGVKIQNERHTYLVGVQGLGHLSEIHVYLVEFYLVRLRTSYCLDTFNML